MKYQKSVIDKVILLLAIMLLLSSCASSHVQPEHEMRTIDVGSYTVDIPPDGNWQIDIDKGEGIIAFQKPKKWWTGRVLGSTLIQTFRNSVNSQIWNLNEEAVADYFRNNKEKSMREEGVQKGLYDLINLEKNTETIDGKNLFTMYYKIEAEWPGGVAEHGLSGRRTQEVMLYLYFPPDFKVKHVFYCFLIKEDIERGSLARIDLTQIYPVIRGFKIKEEETK